MTLTEARAVVRQFARNAQASDVYQDADVDRAIQAVGTRFCRVTQCVKTTGAADLAASTYAYDLTTTVGATFRPERLIDAYLLDTDSEPVRTQPEAVRRGDYGDVLKLLATDTAEGPPTDLAFATMASAVVYPRPDQAYKLKLRWWLPFTTWTAGCDSVAASAVTLNIPADLLADGILVLGAPALLQHNDSEHAYASVSWQKYLAWEQELRGAGSYGARAVRRKMAD